MEITLNGGRIALIDDEDYPLIAGLTWYATPGRRGQIKGAYAFVKQWHPLWGKYKRIAMHRLIMNFPEGMMVDHIDCNTLDNRRSNLRVATAAQNVWNARLRYNNRYGIKGIQKEVTGRFVARMEHHGERIYLGIYDTPEEAGAAYAAAVIKYKGEFARIK